MNRREVGELLMYGLLIGWVWYGISRELETVGIIVGSLLVLLVVRWTYRVTR